MNDELYHSGKKGMRWRIHKYKKILNGKYIYDNLLTGNAYEKEDNDAMVRAYEFEKRAYDAINEDHYRREYLSYLAMVQKANRAKRDYYTKSGKGRVESVLYKISKGKYGTNYESMEHRVKQRLLWRKAGRGGKGPLYRPVARKKKVTRT